MQVNLLFFFCTSFSRRKAEAKQNNNNDRNTKRDVLSQSLYLVFLLKLYNRWNCRDWVCFGFKCGAKKP